MCSCDQSLVTLVFLWEKLSQPEFYKDLTRKTAFFEEWSWFKFNNLGLALGTNLKFYTSVAKGLKLKVRKFLGLISMLISRIYRGREGLFAPLPSWIGLTEAALHRCSYKKVYLQENTHAEVWFQKSCFATMDLWTAASALAYWRLQ